MKGLLEARVAAVNRAHRRAAQLHRDLMAVFGPLVGERVVNGDGHLSKRVAALLPALPCTASLHVYQRTSDYSLAWAVKTCEDVPDVGCCTYFETTVYVGKLEDQVLTGLTGPDPLRDDYTAAEVLEGRRRFEDAKRLADRAEAALYPFGTSDR